MRRRRNGYGGYFGTGIPAAMLTAVVLLGGCANGKSPGTVVNDALEPMFPPSPSEAARDAFNVYDPDKRRRSVNLLSSADFGGEKEYIKTYRLLVDDPDPTVRAACLRALGQHGTPDDVDRILPYLEDENVFVRWEAARALQRLHHEDAIDPLLRALRDDTAPEVRQAAASALAQYPRSRVFQALVGALNDDDYAVIRQAVRSLRTLTGQDFGEDGSRWLSWADEHDELFAGKQPYYYPQYDAPPSFWQKLKFWATEEAPQRRRPRGLEVAAAEGEPSAQQAAGGSSERSASRESGESSGSSASAEPRTDSSRSDSDSDKSKDDAEAWRKAHPLGATDGG